MHIYAMLRGFYLFIPAPTDEKSWRFKLTQMMKKHELGDVAFTFKDTTHTKCDEKLLQKKVLGLCKSERIMNIKREANLM